MLAAGLGVQPGGCLCAAPHRLRLHTTHRAVTAGAASSHWVVPPRRRVMWTTTTTHGGDESPGANLYDAARQSRRSWSWRGRLTSTAALSSTGGSGGGGGTVGGGVSGDAGARGKASTPRTIRSVSSSLARGGSTRAGAEQQESTKLLPTEEDDPEGAKPHNRAARARGGSKKKAVTSSLTKHAAAAAKAKTAAAAAKREAATARRRSGGRNADGRSSSNEKVKYFSTNYADRKGGGDKLPPLLDSEQELQYGRAIQELLRVGLDTTFHFTILLCVNTHSIDDTPYRPHVTNLTPPGSECNPR
jgi:hypothetical protein